MNDRQFLNTHADDKDFLESLNPNSLKVVSTIMEPSLASDVAGQNFQFERHGDFVAERVDLVDHVQGNKPVFNLTVGLKDGWGREYRESIYLRNLNDALFTNVLPAKARQLI